MNAVKVVVVDDKDKKGNPIKRRYILQYNGDSAIFREHLLGGYKPIPLPEGCEVRYKKPKDGRIPIPYLKGSKNFKKYE
jgi:hypothetical protein